MKTMKTLSRRIAALLLVVTVGITALAPAASASSIQLPSLPKDQCVVDDAGVLSDSTTSELKTLNAQLSSSCDGAQIGAHSTLRMGALVAPKVQIGRHCELGWPQRYGQDVAAKTIFDPRYDAPIYTYN